MHYDLFIMAVDHVRHLSQTVTGASCRVDGYSSRTQPLYRWIVRPAFDAQLYAPPRDAANVATQPTKSSSL